MDLKDLPFSDIYLGEQASWLAGVPGKLDPEPTPESVADDVQELRQLCEESFAKDVKIEFAIRHKGITYRASVMQTMSEVVFVLRKFPTKVPRLDDLGIHTAYVNRLMTPGMTGLIVVSGAFGQGKTTTASATIASRIAKYGGIAVTIEDPPEMPMEGRHGEGVCYQTWSVYGKFGEACRQAARWAPSIIFVGEVRDAETATEALRASINGRLVVCTVHADNVISAIERLYALANGAAGSSEDVASLLAQGLAAVLHQRLEGDPRRPRLEFLFLRDNDSAGARSMIRGRKFEQLGTEITLQLNRIMFAENNGTEARRATQ